MTSFPKSERPPVTIPFFAFRIMVGCGIILLALAWLGSIQALHQRLQQNRLLLRAIFLAFPLPFVATLTGWFTAEVGRQPWTVYGLLRTADASTPDLAAGSVLTTLILFCCIYFVVFSFGTLFIFRLLRAGPSPQTSVEAPNPKRPLAIAGNPVLAPTFIVQSSE